MPKTKQKEEAGAEGLKRKKFYPGDVIFQQGKEGDTAYLIAEGEVEIYRTSGRGELGVASLSRGEIFGEMSLIDGHPRAASARAVGEVEVVLITPKDLEKRLKALAGTDGVLRRLIDVYVLRLRGHLTRGE